MTEPPISEQNKGLIEIDEADDLYSLKKTLWANQTLLIKLNDHARTANRTLADIKYWVQFIAGVGILALLIYWRKS